ncbi:hypothetical protein ACWEPH_31585 [Nocardia beijingensis]|nr:hypothetical protein [Nocardia beijingensis]
MGLFVAFAVPLVVFFAVVFWPERIPKERTVDAIRERIEREGGS